MTTESEIELLIAWLRKRGEPDSGIDYRQGNSWEDSVVRLHGTDADFIAKHFHGQGARDLAAALSASRTIPAGVGVNIRPLEWTWHDAPYFTWVADSVFGEGTYRAWQISGHARVIRPGDMAGVIVGKTVEEAKAAAQADYEARIRSTLLPSPSVSDERAAALEEAAKVAKGWLNDWANELFATRDAYIEAQSSGRHAGRRIDPSNAKMYAGQFRERAEAVAGCADEVAAAIRALTPKEAR